jgi:hypothetical protein
MLSVAKDMSISKTDHEAISNNELQEEYALANEANDIENQRMETQ